MKVSTFFVIINISVYAQKIKKDNWWAKRQKRRELKENRLRLTTTPPMTTTQPASYRPKRPRKSKKQRLEQQEQFKYFPINTENLDIQMDYDPSAGIAVSFHDLLLRKQQKTPADPRFRTMGGGPPATIHPNTRNIAGMLRYRLLALGVSMNFKDLLGYGCWCTFLIRHDMRPKSMQPLDEIDSVCRHWTKCHECSSIDSYYQCSAQGHDEYKVKGIVATGKFTCESNVDTCALRACGCDTALVYKLAELLVENPKRFSFLKTYRTGFNPYEQCQQVPRFEEKKSDKCCGDFPNRFPFYSNFGAKGCCGKKTYDMALFECCSDGRLVSKGTACTRNF